MKNTNEFKCGFIGLGNQGAPIAQKIIESGFPMTVWARRSETLLPFRDTNASVATSIEELALKTNYVAVCVASDRGVTEVCESLIHHLRAGSFLVVHSTALPSTIQRLAALASSHQVSLIDAPVSGGRPAAERGALTVMTGGDPNDIAQIRPILACFSSQLFHLGGVGSAQAAKLINNSLMAATMGLSVCALDLGVKAGLDKAGLVKLFTESSGRSFALEVLARHGDSHNMTFKMTLQEKVTLLGEVLGTDHPTYQAFETAAAQISN
jgi:3-hydroxyisobutyrate dehydrogenase